MSSQPSPNFAYLAYHDARLVALATQVEDAFATDPPTSIAKLRLFAEILAERAAARVGLLSAPNETQQTLVDRLFEKKVIGATQRTVFYDLRRAGNAAVHETTAARTKPFTSSAWRVSSRSGSSARSATIASSTRGRSSRRPRRRASRPRALRSTTSSRGFLRALKNLTLGAAPITSDDDRDVQQSYEAVAKAAVLKTKARRSVRFFVVENRQLHEYRLSSRGPLREYPNRLIRGLVRAAR